MTGYPCIQRFQGHILEEAEYSADFTLLSYSSP